MLVMVKAHSRMPVVLGTVVAMPTSTILVIKTDSGEVVRVHESLVRQYL